MPNDPSDPNAHAMGFPNGTNILEFVRRWLGVRSWEPLPLFGTHA